MTPKFPLRKIFSFPFCSPILKPNFDLNKLFHSKVKILAIQSIFFLKKALFNSLCFYLFKFTRRNFFKIIFCTVGKMKGLSLSRCRFSTGRREKMSELILITWFSVRPRSLDSSTLRPTVRYLLRPNSVSSDRTWSCEKAVLGRFRHSPLGGFAINSIIFFENISFFVVLI